MYCNKCGKELNKEDKFCSSCGNKIKIAVEEKKSQTQVTFDRKEKDSEEKKSKFKMEDLTWDLDAFPDDNKKNKENESKEETFNWDVDSKLEEKKANRDDQKHEPTSFNANWEVDVPMSWVPYSEKSTDVIVDDSKEDHSAMDWVPEVEHKNHLDEDFSELKEKLKGKFHEVKDAVVLDDIESQDKNSIDKDKKEEDKEESLCDAIKDTIRYKTDDIYKVERLKDEEELELDEYLTGNNELLEKEKSSLDDLKTKANQSQEKCENSKEKMAHADVTKSSEKNSESSKDKLDRFFTFNQKNEEFQSLLDAEYEKLRKRLEKESEEEIELKNKYESLKKELGLDIEPLDLDKREESSKKINNDDIEKDVFDLMSNDATDDAAIESFEKEQKETLINDKSEDDENQKVVAIEQPKVPKAVDLSENNKGKDDKTPNNDSKSKGGKNLESLNSKKINNKDNLSKKGTSKKTRATYAGIFTDEEDLAKLKGQKNNRRNTKVDLEKDDLKPKNDRKKSEAIIGMGLEENNHIEKQADLRKKNIFLDIIIVILSILVIIVGIGMFIPNTPPGKIVNKYLSTVTNFFTGNENEPITVKEKAKKNEEKKLSGIEKGIITANKEYKNIGKISLDKELVFQKDKDYGDEVAKTFPLEDSPWFSEKNEPVSYGNAIVRTISNYYSDYSKLKDKGNKEDILSLVKKDNQLYKSLKAETMSKSDYKVLKLKIGEIRVEGDNYYALVQVLSKDGDKEESKKSIIKLVPDDKKMIIENVISVK